MRITRPSLRTAQSLQIPPRGQQEGRNVFPGRDVEPLELRLEPVLGAGRQPGERGGQPMKPIDLYVAVAAASFMLAFVADNVRGQSTPSQGQGQALRNPMQSAPAPAPGAANPGASVAKPPAAEPAKPAPAEPEVAALIVAGQETTLSSQMAGRIRQLRVGLGDKVKKGAPPDRVRLLRAAGATRHGGRRIPRRARDAPCAPAAAGARRRGRARGHGGGRCGGQGAQPGYAAQIAARVLRRARAVRRQRRAPARQGFRERQRGATARRPGEPRFAEGADVRARLRGSPGCSPARR